MEIYKLYYLYILSHRRFNLLKVKYIYTVYIYIYDYTYNWSSRCHASNEVWKGKFSHNYLAVVKTSNYCPFLRKVLRNMQKKLVNNKIINEDEFAEKLSVASACDAVGHARLLSHIVKHWPPLQNASIPKWWARRTARVCWSLICSDAAMVSYFLPKHCNISFVFMWISQTHSQLDDFLWSLILLIFLLQVFQSLYKIHNNSYRIRLRLRGHFTNVLNINCICVMLEFWLLHFCSISQHNGPSIPDLCSFFNNSSIVLISVHILMFHIR